MTSIEDLNRRALAACAPLQDADMRQQLRVTETEMPGGGRVLDCGVRAEGGLRAGLELARVCLAGLAEVTLQPGTTGQWTGPHIAVWTDAPVRACLCSQYAGWQVSVGEFFAMGSGPMRAAAAVEELFQDLNYRESADAVVGVLETSRLPTDDVFASLSEATGVAADRITLLVARTASQAGTIQVVARALETALHKLHELGYDLSRIVSGWGTAPLPPVAADDLTGIGWTNDAVLYGGRVELWVRDDDGRLAEIGPQVPASASSAYGRPFLDIFEAAGRDFYKIDPLLFSPAEITFRNLSSGAAHRFGTVRPDVLQQSFGPRTS